MKKHILLGAALLSLFAASCSNDDIINNDNEVVNGKTITLNATINNGADTRMTYDDDARNNKMTVAWSNNEKFTMYKGINGTGSTFTNSADNTGKFKGDDITGNGTYYAVYGEDITNSAGTLTIDLSGAQVGTNAENGIKEFMLATASELNSSTTLTFNHKLTVLKMTLTLPEDVTGTVSMVTVSGLHNKASYSLSDGSYAYADDNKGDITATNGTTGFEIKATVDGETTKKSFTAYVAVFPESVTANQVTIKAAVGDNEYSYTIANARPLQENQVVPVQVTLAAPKTNFKSAYTKEDYFRWDAYTYVNNGSNNFSENNYGYNTGSSVTASHSCASCPTASQMVAYLKAGVYWDDSSITEGQMTYSAPKGGTDGSSIEQNLHTGLWVKKKNVIGEAFDNETDQEYKTKYQIPEVFKKLSEQSAAEVKRIRTGGDYFFLPATGYYQGGGFSGSSYNFYWSSSSCISYSYAYYLYFDNSYASVATQLRYFGYRPMVAE